MNPQHFFKQNKTKQEAFYQVRQHTRYSYKDRFYRKTKQTLVIIPVLWCISLFDFFMEII